MRYLARISLLLEIIVTACAALYEASYLVLVERPLVMTVVRPLRAAAIANPDANPAFISPNYHLGGNLAAEFFAPLHEIDKRIKPGAWTRDAGFD